MDDEKGIPVAVIIIVNCQGQDEGDVYTCSLFVSIIEPCREEQAERAARPSERETHKHKRANTYAQDLRESTHPCRSRSRMCERARENAAQRIAVCEIKTSKTRKRAERNCTRQNAERTRTHHRRDA